MRVSYPELFSLEIKGRKAIVTQPENYGWYERHHIAVPTVILNRIEHRRESGHEWLRLYFESSDPHSCGYSGYRLDRENPLTVEMV